MKKSLLIFCVLALSLFTTFTIYGMFMFDPFNTYLMAFTVACTAWSFVPILFERKLAPVQHEED
ncbi:MAG: hypothetical protein AAFU60_06900 [Bacteroidota bacterium]